MADPPPFTLAGARRGAMAVGPLAPAVALYGTVFGVLAASKGLGAVDAMLFSAIVNAGGAQFASLAVWAEPPPLLALALTTLAMNARYLLMGATLHPWMGALPHSRSLPALFVMGDGNWALALREHEMGRIDAAFLLGSGLVLWIVWIAATGLGHAAGALVDDPRRFGLDLMLAAFFAAIAATFVRSRRDLLPFLAGAAAAIVIDRVASGPTPGPWAVLGGAVLGSLVGLALDGRSR
ncbi:AzlC family ABC transporter permease [Elioraea rosea]|uniref:AzlC family ABC transporter permease n=1 Tax=Elioraea rosea TaxID=2492390 RepID=UPI0011828CBE|nr:AzlC family ABC transporter permease [Elioraea rosea]